MTALPLGFKYNYKEIRAVGGVVTEGSRAWLADLAPVSAATQPAFGTDEFAQLATSFHTRTHARSMDYYSEVGDAAGDVGLGLAKMSNLYEAVEKTAVDRIDIIIDALTLMADAEVGFL